MGGSYDSKSFSVGQIRTDSGISWLHDTLIQRANARREDLKEKIARGAPIHEYTQLVGRCEELRRFISIDVPELFSDFYQSDAEEGEDDV